MTLNFLYNKVLKTGYNKPQYFLQLIQPMSSQLINFELQHFAMLVKTLVYLEKEKKMVTVLKIRLIPSDREPSSIES